MPVNVHDRGMFLEHVLADSCARVWIVHDSLLAEIEASADRIPSLDTIVVVGDVSARPLPGRAVLRYDEWRRDIAG